MLYAEEVYSIIGACFEVYKRMGCGFLEAVYLESIGDIGFENTEKMAILNSFGLD